MRILPRILVPARYREDPRYAQEFAIPVILAVSMRLAMLLLLPSLLAIGLVQYEADNRSDSLLTVIERLEVTEGRLADETKRHRQDVSDADKVLCQGINAERKIIADLIRSVIAARETVAGRRAQANVFAEALVKLEPRDCEKLPSG